MFCLRDTAAYVFCKGSVTFISRLPNKARIYIKNVMNANIPQRFYCSLDSIFHFHSNCIQERYIGSKTSTE